MLGNWIKETTTTTGTGNITLAGAVSGFSSFDAQFPNATRRYFYYVIESGTSRELGLGHLTSSTTLVRDQVYSTLVSGTYTRYTGAGTPITLAGTSTIYCDMSAEAGQSPGVANSASNGVVPHQITGGNFTTTAGRDGGFQWLWPFTLPISGTYSGVRFHVTTTGSGSLKAGIYDVGTNGLPDRLIATRATGLTVSTGAQTLSFDASVFLQASKFYYLAFLSDNTITYTASIGYGFMDCGVLGAESSTVKPADAAFISQTYSSGLLAPFSGSPTIECGRFLPLVSFVRT